MFRISGTGYSYYGNTGYGLRDTSSWKKVVAPRFESITLFRHSQSLIGIGYRKDDERHDVEDLLETYLFKEVIDGKVRVVDMDGDDMSECDICCCEGGGDFRCDNCYNTVCENCFCTESNCCVECLD